jgi:predicted NUDIX family NTP pyrophosphohydrolase
MVGFLVACRVINFARANPTRAQRLDQFILLINRANLAGFRGESSYRLSMAKVSAGLLMYRVRNGELEFLLAHPGGPFWQDRDLGAWTIPKGEIQEGEEPLAAARREFEEEVGFKPEGNLIALTWIRQRSGKTVHAWAFEGDADVSRVRSNTFQMEWPPHSGCFVTCPEVDRAGFFRMAGAKLKINPAQVLFLEELEKKWRNERNEG